jgi:hypothetical protein
MTELILLGKVTVAGIPETGMCYLTVKSLRVALCSYSLVYSIKLNLALVYLELPAEIAHAS